MSSALPTIDLTGAVVGTQKTLDFNQFVKFNPSQFSQNANLEIFNESGCGLNVTMLQSGHTKYIPAGLWGVIPIMPNDGQMQVTVTYVLPNPPVSQLTAIYYQPGEDIPPGYTLGNSPIGIGGAVSVSSVQTLSNEGSAAPLLVIDMGDTGFNQIVTIYNDGHALWAVDVSGVKHQVIKVSTTGNPLQLGQAGDTTEVLGALLVDQTLSTTGNTTVNGSLITNTIRDNVTGVDQIDLATAGATFNNLATFNGSLPSISAKHGINFGTPGDTAYLQSSGATILSVDVNNKNLTLNGPNIGGGGSLVLQVGGVSAMTVDSSQQCNFVHSVFLPVGSLGQLSTFNGTGNGTVATGITNPTAIAFDPCTVSGSSQTIGGTVASSSVVTTGSGLAWRGTAWHN